MWIKIRLATSRGTVARMSGADEMAARWFKCIQQVILRLSPGKQEDAWFGVPMRVPPVLEQAANLTQTNPVFVRPCRTAPFGLQAEMRPAESSRHNAAKRNTRCMRTTRCILAQVEGKTVLGCDNHRRPLQPLVTSDRTPSTLQGWRSAQEYFKSGWRV